MSCRGAARNCQELSGSLPGSVWELPGATRRNCSFLKSWFLAQGAWDRLRRQSLLVPRFPFWNICLVPLNVNRVVWFVPLTSPRQTDSRCLRHLAYFSGKRCEHRKSICRNLVRP